MIISFIKMFQHIDVILFRFINDTLSSLLLNCAMPAISFIGDKITLSLLLGILFIFGTKRLKLTAVIAGTSFLITLVTVGCLKQIVARPRPASALADVHVRDNTNNNDSFPSGHTAFSFSIASVASHRHRRVAPFLFILAGLIGFSRVYLGVHYPLDVFAGTAIGIFIGVVCYRLAYSSLQLRD